MMRYSTSPLPLVLLSLLLFPSPSLSGVPHSHQHEHHGKAGREREDDGAFSPRDRTHHHGSEHDSSFDHEAILGSAKEAEEFDELPPREAKEKLAKLLEKMDRNRDQKVRISFEIGLVFLSRVCSIL